MKFIVGIGNAGKKYDNTRHNIGFMVVDELSKRYNAGWKRVGKFGASLAQLNDDIRLVKSELFVNNTGKTLSEIKKEKEFEPEDLLVVCDDINLSFSKLRLRRVGTSGGHNGLESIIGYLQTEYFRRLRIGIKNNEMPYDVTNFVLKPFDDEEKRQLKKTIEDAASVCDAWANQGFEEAKNLLSRLQSK